MQNENEESFFVSCLEFFSTQGSAGKRNVYHLIRRKKEKILLQKCQTRSYWTFSRQVVDKMSYTVQTSPTHQDSKPQRKRNMNAHDKRRRNRIFQILSCPSLVVRDFQLLPQSSIQNYPNGALMSHKKHAPLKKRGPNSRRQSETSHGPFLSFRRAAPRGIPANRNHQ